MTHDPTLILAATTILLSLAGLCLFARVRRAERELITLKADTLTIVCRLSDDLANLRAEQLAQARALDAHDERLQVLERDTTDLNAAHFKTATTVEDHGERLDYVERHVPDPS